MLPFLALERFCTGFLRRCLSVWTTQCDQHLLVYLLPNFVLPMDTGVLRTRAGCERLQTTYVRYRGKGAIVAPQGWELNACRRNCTQLIQNQDLFVPEDHPIYTDFVPVSVDIKLLEAPAEFAMPVKQDR